MLEVTFCWALTETWWKTVETQRGSSGGKLCSPPTGPQGAAVQVAGARDPGWRWSGGSRSQLAWSRRSRACRQGNRASCKQPREQDAVRPEQTPEKSVGRGPDSYGAKYPTAAVSCRSQRGAAAQRHGQDGMVRARPRSSHPLPVPAALARRPPDCTELPAPWAPHGGLESLRGFSFRAWERLKTLSGACRTRVAGLCVVQVFLRGWWPVKSPSTHK